MVAAGAVWQYQFCGAEVPEKIDLPGDNAPEADRPTIIWGGTGQSKVVRPILEASGCRIILVFDNSGTVRSPFADIPMGGDWDAFLRWRSANSGKFWFSVCIGGSRGRDRAAIFSQLLRYGLSPISALHERAWIARTAAVGRGCQVLAMAAVSEYTRVGDASIINTNASVDHDCVLGTGVHIMPGATVAGEVEIGDFGTIGTNATVLPRVRIGQEAIVGAGAVVTRDVPDGKVVVGCPARELKRARESAAGNQRERV
jgi:sugar O-acyltransferase (sialic acid O-acetyltransferase NeuD family)